uniref:Anaphase-promoting complex subunit 4 WD40 domain-containing protein n=1 Tax=Hyaloperonospora arabidopsidis (strain Emoy2) TaxID=559515 RepID=M4BYM9_HYAAE
MACHPRDANLLLLAYDTCSTVLLWNLAKRKVVREFTLSEKANMSLSRTKSTSSSVSCVDEEPIVKSPQSLSWHCSGKTFVVGYKQGGIAVFLVDKSVECIDTLQK